MRKSALYFMSCALIAMPMWAAAQTAELTEAEKAFRAADIIPDGQLDRGEYDIYSNSVFKGLDKDGDGNLTPQECLKNCFKDKELGKEQDAGVVDYQFNPIDIDENGIISGYEYILFDRERFDQMDINHNGALDTEEFCSVYEPMKPCVFSTMPVIEETP